MLRLNRHIVWGLFFFSVALNIWFWQFSHVKQAAWANVPPVHTHQKTLALGLGDDQLSYRVIGVMLQNLGGSGGRTVKFEDYDYDYLVRWFELAQSLDARSNFIPMLAAYYYGAVHDPEQARVLITYLRKIGSIPGGQHWRWLAHAVHIARFQVQDLDLAYEIAQQLAALPDKNIPFWTKQMPAYVMTAKGNKEAAYDIVMEILKSSVEELSPDEIHVMRDYVCNTLLDAAAASAHPLCKDIP